MTRVGDPVSSRMPIQAKPILCKRLTMATSPQRIRRLLRLCGAVEALHGTVREPA